MSARIYEHAHRRARELGLERRASVYEEVVARVTRDYELALRILEQYAEVFPRLAQLVEELGRHAWRDLIDRYLRRVKRRIARIREEAIRRTVEEAIESAKDIAEAVRDVTEMATRTIDSHMLYLATLDAIIEDMRRGRMRDIDELPEALRDLYWMYSTRAHGLNVYGLFVDNIIAQYLATYYRLYIFDVYVLLEFVTPACSTLSGTTTRYATLKVAEGVRGDAVQHILDNLDAYIRDALAGLGYSPAEIDEILSNVASVRVFVKLHGRR